MCFKMTRFIFKIAVCCRSVAHISIIGFVLIALLPYVPANGSQNTTIYPPVDENDPNSQLYFGLMVSFDQEMNTSSNVAGVQLALDRINNDPSLLQNYTLHYVLSDSQVGWTLRQSSY